MTAKTIGASLLLVLSATAQTRIPPRSLTPLQAHPLLFGLAVVVLLPLLIHDIREYRAWGEIHAFAPVVFYAVMIFGVWAWFASKPFEGRQIIAGRDGFEVHGGSLGDSFLWLLVLAAVLVGIYVWRITALNRRKQDYANTLRESEPPEPSPGRSAGASPNRLKDTGLV